MQLSFLCSQQPEPSSGKIRRVEHGESRGTCVVQGALGEQSGYSKVLVATSHSLHYRYLTRWLDFHSFLLDSSCFAYGLVYHRNVLFQETDTAVDFVLIWSKYLVRELWCWRNEMDKDCCTNVYRMFLLFYNFSVCVNCYEVKSWGVK